MQQGEGKGRQLYTKEEAAELLRVSPVTVHRHIKEGKLGSYRMGSRVLVSASHIEDYLARCERPPRAKRGGTRAA
jgi:excisionase family DNA binding protein